MNGYDGLIVTVSTASGFETWVFRTSDACDAWVKANSRIGEWRPHVQGFRFQDNVTP